MNPSSHPGRRWIGHPVGRYWDDVKYIGIVDNFTPADEDYPADLWHVSYQRDHDSEEISEDELIEALAAA